MQLVNYISNGAFNHALTVLVILLFIAMVCILTAINSRCKFIREKDSETVQASKDAIDVVNNLITSIQSVDKEIRVVINEISSIREMIYLTNADVKQRQLEADALESKLTKHVKVSDSRLQEFSESLIILNKQLSDLQKDVKPT